MNPNRPTPDFAGVGATPVFRLRPEVRAVPRWRGLQRFWVLKQAMTLEHFEVTEDEWFLLRHLDGSTSPDGVRKLYNERHQPRRLSEAGMNQFLKQAFELGVVGVTGLGRSAAIETLQQRNRRRRAVGRLLSVVAPRVSLFDPTPLLRVLSPLASVLFRPSTATIALASAAVLIALAVGRAGEIAQQVGSLSGLLAGGGWVWMVLLWAVVKFCHELGHAMACRHFGGECHDLGVFFIAGAPAPYCDVTDAWSFPSQWRRAVVSAAGVYVELLIAVACGALWLAVEPGWLRDQLGRTVLICGVSTLLFNANPLLRLDGYYLLSDLTNRPNLFEQSRRALSGPVLRWLTRGRLGGKPEPVGVATQLYGMASIAYRLVVVSVIGWIVWNSLKGYGLETLGVVFLVLLAASLVAPGVRFVWSVSRSPTSRRVFVPVRTGLLLGGAAIGVLAVLMAPAPESIRVAAIVEYVDSQAVVAPSDGRIVPSVRYGDRVAKGDLIGRLEDPALELELARAEATLEETRLERRLVEQELTFSDDAAARAEALAAYEQAAVDRLGALRKERHDLTLVAARDGVVTPPPTRDPQPAVEGELQSWTGTPISGENRGCWVASGESLCEVGDPSETRCLLLVEQASIDLVREGAAVRLRLDNTPGDTLDAVVTAVGGRRVLAAPPPLLASQRIATATTPSGSQRVADNYFVVEAPIDPRDATRLRVRSTGWARVVTSNRTLGAWLWRELSRLFAIAS